MFTTLSFVIFSSCFLVARSRADVSAPTLDPRDCVCTVIREAPIDIFTARMIPTPIGNQLEVVEILTHGSPERQVSGELIAGLTIFYGDSPNTGFFLVYAGARSGDFYGVSISQLGDATVLLRTLMINVSPGNAYDKHCKTGFSLTQLRSFANAFAEGEGTCPQLATEYLGIPKPLAQNDSMLQCGGGASPDWLVAIFTVLGFLAFRAQRRRAGRVLSRDIG